VQSLTDAPTKLLHLIFDDVWWKLAHCVGVLAVTTYAMATLPLALHPIGAETQDCVGLSSSMHPAQKHAAAYMTACSMRSLPWLWSRGGPGASPRTAMPLTTQLAALQTTWKY
jgi:hypothetical protein